LKKIFLLSLLVISQHLHAAPFAEANAKAGQTLVEKNCISCHASSYGEDGSGIYTRENRKVKSSKGLVAQIRNCNTMLGLKWFEDEELNVAAYLNQNYYHFTE
jgi:cytochrome c2